MIISPGFFLICARSCKSRQNKPSSVLHGGTFVPVKKLFDNNSNDCMIHTFV
jgi:hypothetical protein